MPIGRSFTLDLMMTPEQRLRLFERVWWLVRNRHIFIADFWNSATATNGCVAAGRAGGYFHVNWNGDVSPCVFFPYSPVNVKDVFARGGTLDDVWAHPFFADIRSWQRDYGYREANEACPDCGNWLAPCIIRDHHSDFLELVRRHEPAPTRRGRARRPRRPRVPRGARAVRAGARGPDRPGVARALRAGEGHAARPDEAALGEPAWARSDTIGAHGPPGAAGCALAVLGLLPPCAARALRRGRAGRQPAATRVTQEHRYRLSAAIRPLLFWVGAKNVGGARIVWRPTEEGGRATSCCSGPTPPGRPRRINRWGWVREDADASGATMFGVMNRSEDDSLDQAASLRASRPRPRQGRLSLQDDPRPRRRGGARAEATTVYAPQDFTFRQLEDLLRFADEAKPVAARPDGRAAPGDAPRPAVRPGRPRRRGGRGGPRSGNGGADAPQGAVHLQRRDSTT